MEASFGWNWLADEMTAAGMKVSLSNCYKLEQMRKARGGAKTNRKDADLVSLLPMELSDWGNPGTPYEWHCRADGVPGFPPIERTPAGLDPRGQLRGDRLGSRREAVDIAGALRTASSSTASVT